MANTKTSDESAASALTGSELVRIVQSGSNVRTTVGAIAATAGFDHVAVSSNTTLPSQNAIVDVDTSSVTAPGTMTLTLPTPAEGRLYIIRKVGGAADETITLARAASEKIDNVTASRVLTGSDQFVDNATWYFPVALWLVWSDGTNWKTSHLGTLSRTRIVAGAPSDSTNAYIVEEGAYYPGSLWYDSSGVKMYMAMCMSGFTTSWHRVDAVDVESVTANTTLPSKDRSMFVDTGSGAVTLTLPSPTGRNAGRQFSITKTNTGTNKITLARNASESINGSAANLDLPGSTDADYGRWHVVSDGTNWWVTGGSGLT